MIKILKKFLRKKVFFYFSFDKYNYFWNFLFLFHNSTNPDSEVQQGTVTYNSKFKGKEGNIIFPAYTQDLELKKNQTLLPILLVNPLVNKDIYLQYKISITENAQKNNLFGRN